VRSAKNDWTSVIGDLIDYGVESHQSDITNHESPIAKGAADADEFL
jgi:hypothetical protein